MGDVTALLSLDGKHHFPEAACMVGVVLSAFFCNIEEAGVEGPEAASAFLIERQTPKEFPHPHRQRR
ncbi:MAG: hypothetical protein WCA45_00315 [Thiobacillaceae bacterium]